MNTLLALGTAMAHVCALHAHRVSSIFGTQFWESGEHLLSFRGYKELEAL
jgi:hypothetical protein